MVFHTHCPLYKQNMSSSVHSGRFSNLDWMYKLFIKNVNGIYESFLTRAPSYYSFICMMDRGPVTRRKFVSAYVSLKSSVNVNYYTVFQMDINCVLLSLRFETTEKSEINNAALCIELLYAYSTYLNRCIVILISN